MTAPAVALLGAFVAYPAQPQRPNPVASSMASYHRLTLSPGGVVADGSGTAMTTHRAKGGQDTKNGKTDTTARHRRAHRVRSGAKTPTAVPSPSAVQQDIAHGNYLLAVAQYLVENGYSDAAAAGVASCVEGESGGNPELVADGGAGLISWTPTGSAAPNSNIVTGNAAQDTMTQLADILYYDSTEIGQSLVAQLNSISDPVAAADFYSQNFEKPAVTDSDVVPSVAEQIFSQLRGL